MSMYPDNLLYFVKKLSGYSRNNVKVLPLTSTTSGNGQVVQFRLPTNSLIDLSTWCMHGNLAVTGTGAEAAFGRDTASMIRNVQVQVGGQTVQHLNSYGTVWQALKQSTMSTSASASNKWLEFDAKPVAVTHDQTAVPFVIRNWLGFFQASPSIIDTSLLGEIVISLTIETDGKKYARNEASCTAVTLALSELFSSIDLISIQDGVYDMVAQQALASGLMLEIPVPNYFTFQHAATSDDYHTQFTIGCQSLDSAMVLQTLSAATLNDNSNNVAGDGYDIQIGMRFDGTLASQTDGDGWYFEVNGAQVPNHRVNRNYTPYYQKLAFGIHGADHGNLVATELARVGSAGTGWTSDDVDKFYAAQYIPVVRFNHAASDKRLLSGIDARSNPVQISFHHKGTSGAAKAVTVVALCTSTLMVGAGQQLSFSA